MMVALFIDGTLCESIPTDCQFSAAWCMDEVDIHCPCGLSYFQEGFTYNDCMLSPLQDWLLLVKADAFTDNGQVMRRCI